MKPLSPLQKILAATILGLLVFFSLYKLTESPGFGFDEGWAVQVATNIATRGIDGLQFAPGYYQHVSVLMSVGYPLIYALAFMFKLFGAGIVQARIMMAVYLVGAVALGFSLIRRLFGNGYALASFALLATFPPLYAFGKAVAGEGPVQFWFLAFLLCLSMALAAPSDGSSSRRRFWFMLAGFTVGICIVTKTMAISLIPVLGFASFIAYRRNLVTWKDVVAVITCAAVPIATWVIVNFQRGDTLASVADYYGNPAAVTDKIANIKHNLIFLLSTTAGRTTIALLGVWLVSVLVRVVRRIKENSFWQGLISALSLEETIALTWAVVITCAFFKLYGDARYLFPIEVIGLLFLPNSLSVIWARITAIAHITPRINAVWIAVGCIALLGLYQTAFHSYVATLYSSHFEDDLQAYMSEVPTSTAILFYNATQVVPLFHGTNYYQRIVMFEKWQLGTVPAPLINNGKVDMVVMNSAPGSVDSHMSFVGYTTVARFGQLSIMKKK